ncbi:MAG: hypothetical protein WDW38_010251 [Sanguina aurantia]
MKDGGLQIPVQRSQAYLHFSIPPECDGRLTQLFTVLEAQSSALGITDIQLSSSPLEDVFHAVVERTEADRHKL